MHHACNRNASAYRIFESSRLSAQGLSHPRVTQLAGFPDGLPFGVILVTAGPRSSPERFSGYYQFLFGNVVVGIRFGVGVKLLDEPIFEEDLQKYYI